MDTHNNMCMYTRSASVSVTLFTGDQACPPTSHLPPNRNSYSMIRQMNRVCTYVTLSLGTQSTVDSMILGII